MPRAVRPIRVEGDVAYVTLTRGRVALIDAADVAAVSGGNWCTIVQATGHTYAGRSIIVEGRRRTIFMHRVILGVGVDFHVDHRDGNGLDNRRANIRPCTRSENAHNHAISIRNKFGRKGVWGRNGRYRASISYDGRSIHLGTYSTPDEAAAAYIGASKALFGEFSAV